MPYALAFHTYGYFVKLGGNRLKQMMLRKHLGRHCFQTVTQRDLLRFRIGHSHCDVMINVSTMYMDMNSR